MNDLKPCPYCGSMVEIVESVYHFIYFIYCKKCEVNIYENASVTHMGRGNRESLIKRWNTRIDQLKYINSLTKL